MFQNLVERLSVEKIKCITVPMRFHAENTYSAHCLNQGTFPGYKRAQYYSEL